MVCVTVRRVKSFCRPVRRLCDGCAPLRLLTQAAQAGIVAQNNRGLRMALDWMIVQNSWTKKTIGALGYIGDDLAVITAFYDDKDANADGKLSFSEKYLSMFTMKGRALAEVANHAYADPDILMRDPSLYNLRGQLTVAFASGLVAEGIYKAWFGYSISRLSGAVAGALTQSAVKSFVIKKGLEKAVESAYKASIGL